MKANERMNVLANNGIDTSKYFNITLDKELLNKGIMLKLDGDNLTAQLAEEAEALREEIRNNGTVACTKLYRRWICAQMLRIQKAIENRQYWNIEEYMRNFTYSYMRDMIIHELEAQEAILRDNDLETFEERKTFFSKQIIHRHYTEWVQALTRKITNSKIHIQNRSNRRMEQKEYITIGTRNFYLSDARNDQFEVMRMVGSLYNVRENRIGEIKSYCESINKILNKYDVRSEKIFLPTKAFMEAYKASGAYYTLKNLVLFHNANLTDYETGEVLNGTVAFSYLRGYLDEVLDGNGYRVYALMKQCLKENKIDLNNLY